VCVCVGGGVVSYTENCSSVGFIKLKIKLTNAIYYNLERRIRICKTVILPVVLYGCETWSLTLSEEHRLGVLERWALRIIFDRRGMK
jgi:hypothetical protein